MPFVGALGGLVRHVPSPFLSVFSMTSTVGDALLLSFFVSLVDPPPHPSARVVVVPHMFRRLRGQSTEAEPIVGVDVRHRGGASSHALLPGLHPATAPAADTTAPMARGGGDALRRRLRRGGLPWRGCCFSRSISCGGVSVKVRDAALLVALAIVLTIFCTSAVLSYIEDPPEKQWRWVRLCHQFLRSSVREGRQQPRQPQSLPGLIIELPTTGPPGSGVNHGPPYSATELLAMYRDVDFIYTFVNGTSVSHIYYMMVSAACGESVVADELRYALLFTLPTTPACAGMDLRKAATLRDLLRRVSSREAKFLSNRDRESDELRHSFRSVEQHIRWHTGRLLIVSPGHHPTWVDGAKNFLANRCGGDTVKAFRMRGTHLRVTTVHQDALMPYGMHFSRNSHIVEQHLWRVLNITPVHLYFNDDYFVNRDVAITDFFNKYGGTIVRTESNPIKVAARAPSRMGSWRDGVAQTNLFNILELDVHGENHVSKGAMHVWSAFMTNPTEMYTAVSDMPNITAGDGNNGARDHGNWLLTALDNPPDELPENLTTASLNVTETSDELIRRHDAYFAAHAPFVYCTNMFRYLGIRYEREMAHNAFQHRARNGADMLMPFVYNAFVLARPWQASSTFLRYLWYTNIKGLRLDYEKAATDIAAKNEGVLERQRQQRANGERVEDELLLKPPQRPAALVTLDNRDGCAPATRLTGPYYTECVFARFSNSAVENAAVMAKVRVLNPKFFNINAGATTSAAQKELIDFLHERFPHPIYLESGLEPVSDEDRALPKVYAALMRLPVIAVSSFAEGLCPMVRSLQLALPDHTGIVLTAVARHGTGADVDPSLADIRADMRHRFRSAVPAVACAFNDRVRVVRSVGRAPPSIAIAASRGMLLQVVAAALAEGMSSGLLDRPTAASLPSACGVGTGGGGDVRVRAIVLDGRAERLPVRTLRSLRRAVTMPGQTLALEDFDVVPLEDGSGDAVLVLSRQRSDAKAVHWVDGAAESDLLSTFPLPLEAYEDLDAVPVYLP